MMPLTHATVSTFVRLRDVCRARACRQSHCRFVKTNSAQLSPDRSLRTRLSSLSDTMAGAKLGHAGKREPNAKSERQYTQRERGQNQRPRPGYNAEADSVWNQVNLLSSETFP